MDLLCFSHLRWDFVYQRPQHLLSRFAKSDRVFYIEEPEFGSVDDHYDLSPTKDKVVVVKLRLASDASQNDVIERQRKLVDSLLRDEKISEYILWYYTPMALQIGSHLKPQATVFDCMDELSAFKFAPPILLELEQKLLQKADVVFTGGHSLYQAKKNRHSNIHPFPSSIDKAHFSKARNFGIDPADQAAIPHPRLGFYGVIDERFDIDLIARAAAQRPDWHFVLVGPIVKIDPATLPRLANIHYLGGKSYDELPDYLRGWDIAIIPFMLNDSTKFISPTKTPEYLAGGKPVISTAIRDVINPYGEQKLVSIVGNADEFVAAAEREFATLDKSFWLRKVDLLLEDNSWDATWRQMADQIISCYPAPRAKAVASHV